MINGLIRSLLVIVLLISVGQYAQGQPIPPGPPPANPVPISGVELLIGAGIMLGIRKMVVNKKQTD